MFPMPGVVSRPEVWRPRLSIAIMLALQATDAVPLKPGSDSFDLRNVKPPSSEGRACTSRDPNEIIVCGSRGASYRYRALPGEPEPQLPRAEVRLPGGASAAAQLSGQTLPNGMVSNRMMITIKKPF